MSAAIHAEGAGYGMRQYYPPGTTLTGDRSAPWLRHLPALLPQGSAHAHFGISGRGGCSRDCRGKAYPCLLGKVQWRRGECFVEYQQCRCKIQPISGCPRIVGWPRGLHCPFSCPLWPQGLDKIEEMQGRGWTKFATLVVCRELTYEECSIFRWII